MSAPETQLAGSANGAPVVQTGTGGNGERERAAQSAGNCQGGPFRWPFSWALLALLALALNLPGLGRRELRSEEGRRLLPALEMLEGGDWILPTIWGRPYLAKPPAFYWSLALGARGLQAAGQEWPGGEATAAGELPGPGWAPRERAPVSPLSARLVALAAALAAALAIERAGACWMSSGAGGRRGGGACGLIAGGLFLVAPTVLEKATLAEIETSFAAWTALACFGGCAAARAATTWRAAGWALLGGAAAALALGMKGPFALLPLAGGAAWAAFGDRPRRRRWLWTFAVQLAIAAAATAWWLSEVRARGDLGLGSTLAGELGRRGSGGAGRFAVDRVDLLVGVLLGWAPAAPIALLTWARRPDWRAFALAQPATRYCLGALALGGVVLLAWPGVRARYALPLLPFACLLAGQVLAAGAGPGKLQWGGPQWGGLARRVARRCALVYAWVALLGGGVLLGSAAGAFGFLEDLPGGRASAWGGALLIAAGAAGLGLFGRRRGTGHAHLLAAALALFVVLRGVERTVVAPPLEAVDQRVATARWLEARGAPGVGDPWWTDNWAAFNELYYLRGQVRFREPDELGELPPGALLISRRGAHPELFADSGWARLWSWDERSEAAPRPARSLELWRRR